jgi:tripartite-type tricarboxylate transporter receptor subunit TctC
MACRIGFALTVAAALLGAGHAAAQTFPAKPVRIVTSAPGNSDDLAARLIAQGITSGLGQQAIVDNRGVVAVEIAAKAPPDGYTLLLYGSPMWLAPFMRDNLPYDPVRDFTPVTWATNSPNLLVVHPSLPVKSVRELIALARARPGELNYGSGSAGSTPHLAAELFRSMTGVQIVRVAYKGSGPALIALLGGELQFMFPSTGSANPLLKSGRIRALAVTSLEPTALAPGLPTVAASGLPGYESASLLAVFAPAGTPAAIVQRLNQEMVKVLRSAEAKERLASAGVEAVGSTPEQFAATLKTEMARWGKVIRDAGIRAE